MSTKKRASVDVWMPPNLRVGDETMDADCIITLNSHQVQKHSLSCKAHVPVGNAVRGPPATRMIPMIGL